MIGDYGSPDLESLLNDTGLFHSVINRIKFIVFIN